MATYKDIIGTHVRTVTADPPSPVNGQMWYNSTEQVMKGSKFNPAGAWATGGTLNTARHNYWGAATSTDALAIGGNNDSADVGNVENIMVQHGQKLQISLQDVVMLEEEHQHQP